MRSSSRGALPAFLKPAACCIFTQSMITKWAGVFYLLVVIGMPQAATVP
jgi:hypothetical protein